MKIISLKDRWDEALSEAVRVLKGGGLIAYPTDTAYGLGGDTTRRDVVERIYEVKGRPPNKPLSVLFPSLPMVEEWCDVEDHLEILQKYLPGPYTFIVRAKRPLPVGEKVGIRVPNYYFARALARELGRPITATSANISGGKTPHSVEELDEIKGQVDLIIDGGPSPVGGVSTVVDLIERKILRQGRGAFRW